MFTKLSGVVTQWVGAPMKTGLVFWGGGFGMWLLNLLDWSALERFLAGTFTQGEKLVKPQWLPIWDALPKVDGHQTGLVLLILVVAMMLPMGALVSLLTNPTLRFLEGYFWPSFFRRMVSEFYDRRFIQPKIERWHELDIKKRRGNRLLDPEEDIEFTALDLTVVKLPIHPMPTGLGRILRGFEDQVRIKYGLDPIICWPSLWFLMPMESREELTNARTSLDQSIQVILWGMLSLVWIVITKWAALFVFIVMLFGYQRARQAATTYGQLLEAAFDVHRLLLYKALRWSSPLNPGDERAQGERLSQYLWRGHVAKLEFES